MLIIAPELRPTIAQLQQEVLEANLDLVKAGLVLFTFGNASGIHRPSGLLVIKPSGVAYSKLRPADMVVCDLEGTLPENSLRPSSDLHTHLHLYRAFPSIGGIVHTHSLYATSWAQAGKEIPPFGTTHADYFHGPVPITAPLEPHEISGEYVLNTGIAISRRFLHATPALDPLAVPAVLVHGHAPFAWGRTVEDAAHNAIVLENVAQLATNTVLLNPAARPVLQHLLNRHHFRKHGAAATYGQDAPGLTED
jgi:L-ribulose-5-phosphate 4-epimerase